MLNIFESREEISDLCTVNRWQNLDDRRLFFVILKARSSIVKELMEQADKEVTVLTLIAMGLSLMAGISLAF
ncbi:hypothetical protein PCC7424_5657 (plasmid) [Gloeothece citriformis PCC 7424]|uniref:Uncharacterized protein n=1 Tax=Gloeothece citriformis (strain PCC 7424) TaxID=65393 RepID=B7KLQ7_GLOC7|nr:hypothetical protein [Gloeothece citriformis]ACK73729.1 hypothetical protein PCC7424_5657 [Gloeothece citriformis PCC 7424]